MSASASLLTARRLRRPAVALAVVIAALVLLLRDEGGDAEVTSPSVPEGQGQAAPAVPRPVEPGPPAPAPRALATRARPSADPRATPEAPAAATAASSSRSPAEGLDASDSQDPFEPAGERGAPAIETLVAVGDLRLGIVSEGANVRNRAALERSLVRVGDALERLRAEKKSTGASRQELLDSFRRELGQSLDGEVEIRGPGWTAGIEVGTPKGYEEGAPVPQERWRLE